MIWRLVLSQGGEETLSTNAPRGKRPLEDRVKVSLCKPEENSRENSPVSNMIPRLSSLSRTL